MGNSYETDSTSKEQQLSLAIQAAVVMKTLGNLVGCRSCLQARLVVRELQVHFDMLKKVVEELSK